MDLNLTSSPAEHADRLMICDCDGVLIDSEAVAGRVLVEELHALWPGVDVEPVVMPLLGLRIEGVLAGTADTLNRTLTHEQIDAIRRAVEAAAVEAPPVAGIAEALAAIPLRKACASNSFTPYVETVLKRTGLVRFFGERRFCADMVENPKPAPDVYLAAARTLRVSTAHCLVVEDSVTGVTAATAAGMAVLGFIGGGHATEGQIDALRRAGASVVFDDMKRLPALVGEWLQNATFEIR
ncbi:HAD family hydrolase [Caballeronia arationis]|uniref:Haloacid dehalogenase superfamily, subfamily IA, variant 3 with third motif having DD or ED n=2 Tax=Caballeronia arationis TaxID=1777142 RepID=A0A7Z7N430_9BURK|nr:HAD family hydrolase [Caballeronia arationis]SOE80743.1 haloacid dehalogenase superfamily, subfamily IA, variant 3 with third motif having DD or ED [Caballeronia arationis]